MLNINNFSKVEIIDENVDNNTILEEECNEFIMFNKELSLQYKNVTANLEKLILKLDKNTKFKVYKFITKYKHKLYMFKCKTLLPCYISLYFLFEKNIILSVTACKYLFNINIKNNKINEIFSIINELLNTSYNFDENKYNIYFLINGWIYLINYNMNQKFTELCNDIITRIYLFNIKFSCCDNLIPIPNHFNTYKQIDNFMFIFLDLIILLHENKYNIGIPYETKITEVHKFLLNNCINKSYYKITYTKYVITNHLLTYIDKIYKL
ncbi:hypothetical protein [Alphaentomopoxvirus acuprea]|uniref:Uncharacterized protein n=1 Tax=Alphaentomopoxvirus acuprea TaxID=62099 RepID=W6JLM7_9POXV|nr:hypothetical protein BA82_gp191 [Anomala cuprea entomopoxvirus]BAO49551.1 hypothetical protein [Anomala cuprea entomopoxvirus]